MVYRFLSKLRNCLNIVGRGDLLLQPTAIEPNIEEILKKHQLHLSHLLWA